MLKWQLRGLLLPRHSQEVFFKIKISSSKSGQLVQEFKRNLQIRFREFLPVLMMGRWVNFT